MEGYFNWVTGRRRLVVTGFAVTIGLAAVGTRGLAVDYSVEQFFPTWGYERAVFDEYRSVFTGEDAQVVFFLESGARLDQEEYDVLLAVADSFRAAGLDEVA